MGGLRRGATTAGFAGFFVVLGGAGCFGESFEMDGSAEGSSGPGDTGLLSETGADGLDEAGSQDTTGTSGTIGTIGTTGTPDDDTATDDGEDAESTVAQDGSTSDGEVPDDSTSDDGGEDSSTGAGVLGMGDLDPGDLVITEVMWNPGCLGDNCEWFEVYNATEQSVNLLDLHVQDAELDPSDEGRITQDIIVEPGGYAVLTREMDAWNYEVQPSGEYGPNPGLNNSAADMLAILDDAGEVLDETPLFPDGDQGVSWTLWIDTPDAEANDDPSNWCFSATQTPLAGGEDFENGSPLEPGTDCL